MNNNSLSNTKWNSKYHIVFAPKLIRQNIYGKLKIEIEKFLTELCERKAIVIIEAECYPVHIHMLLQILPKYSVSSIMGYLKGQNKSPNIPMFLIIEFTNYIHTIKNKTKL